jgi:uncharacterized SAM-binding protein YcdF (DUF218 family)
VAVAVALLRTGRAKWLIFSGNAGDPHPGVPAGELMRLHAITLGAPEEALIAETGSATTFENMRFGFALASLRGFDRLAILTDAFHLERARALASYFGRPDAGLIAVPGLDREGDVNRVWAILREALAWWFNLAKVAGWELLAAAGMDEDARQELIR